MGSTVSCGASAVAGGIFSNAAGIRVVPWVPTGRWDISRVYRREESRSAAVGSRGLGKKNPAGIVRGIMDCTDARGYNCSCQFWLAGCRKMKPTQSAKDNDGSGCWATYAAFARGQIWLFLQHFMTMICYLGDGKAQNSDQTLTVLGAVYRSLMRFTSKKSFLPWLTAHQFMDGLSQEAVRKPQLSMVPRIWLPLKSEVRQPTLVSAFPHWPFRHPSLVLLNNKWSKWLMDLLSLEATENAPGLCVNRRLTCNDTWSPYQCRELNLALSYLSPVLSYALAPWLAFLPTD